MVPIMTEIDIDNEQYELIHGIWKKVERSLDKYGRESYRRALMFAHRKNGATLDYDRMLSMDAAAIANDIRNLSNHCRHDNWEFEDDGPEILCGWKGVDAPKAAVVHAVEKADCDTIDLLDSRKRDIDAMLDEEEELNRLYGG